MFAVALAVYLLTLFAASFYFARRAPGLEEFVLARRSITLLPLLFTTWVANFGGGALVGWTGGFYQYGLDWWWLPLGFLLALVLANRFAVGKIRESEQFTLPDLMGLRYGNRLRLPSTALVILIGTLAMGFQILAFAGVLNAVAGIPLPAGMALAALTFVGVTAFGGLSGIVLTDLIQGSLILVGLLLATGFVYWQVGGFSQLWLGLPSSHTHLQEFTRSGRAFGDAFAVFGAIATSQVLFQKVMAARSVQVAKRMMYWLIPTFLATYLMLWLLGSSAHVLLGSHLRPEVVIGQLIKERLPSSLALILLATLLGVITTSANAILLGVGSNFARDVYQPVVRRRNWPDRSVLVARLAILSVGTIALLTALWVADIIRMMLVCFWVAGVAFLVPLYGGYVWRRGTPEAAGASMIVGVLGVVLSPVLVSPATMHPTVVGFLLSLIVYVAVGLRTAGNRSSSAHERRT